MLNIKSLDEVLENVYQKAWDRLHKRMHDLNVAFGMVGRGNGKSGYTSFLYIKEVYRIVREYEDEIIRQYPHKRAKHLALYGHGRIQKKNRNRILKEFKRKEKKEC